MSFLSHIFGQKAQRDRYRPLYEAVVAAARDPLWYREGQVPDTIDGRFDMIAALLALVLLRLEREGKAAAEAAALLAETFIDDMEGNVRQIGVGDLMVGKHVGKMMGALGGRLTVFRAAIEKGSGLEAPARRNIYHDMPPSQAALRLVSQRLERFHQDLDSLDADRILGGEIPRP